MSFDPYAEIASGPPTESVVDLDTLRKPAVKCPHPDSWFSRTLCPEPCGAMHDRCTECGVILGHCPVDAWDEQPARYDEGDA